MRVGSLFSGIGGFDLGFERAGMSVVWQSEIDPFAAAVLRKHWPHVPNLGDVRSVRGDAVEPVDVLCGGFPCQDISLAGRGAGIDGERSGLWSEYARIVRECRPSWVIAENVPALRTRGYDRVADDLEAAGYAVQAFVVGADDVGAPHRRKRVWIVAHAKELGSPLGHAGAIRAGATPFEPERRSSADAVAHASGERLRVESGRRSGLLDGERPAQRDDADGCRGARVSADALSSRLPGAERAQLPGAQRDDEGRAAAESRRASPWHEGPPVPAVCELDDGIPAGLVRHRRPALAALGNALLPQIAEAIGRAIMTVEQSING